MILTESEQLIVNNMLNPYVRINPQGQLYKTLSDDALVSLFDKMDDYIDETGRLQRAFGNYDEFYILQLNFVKSKLKDEIRIRPFLLKMQNDQFDKYRTEYNNMIRNKLS